MRGRLLLLAVFVIAVLSSCVQPYLQTDGVPVYVLSDHFHSGILIQEGSEPEYTYTFYTFGDATWYRDGVRSFRAGFEAALRRSEGVVARGTMETDADVQSILDEVRLYGTPNGWLFHVPRAALDRALAHVHTEVMLDPASPTDQTTSGGFTYSFFASRKPYHAFYSCVQFTAEFLAVAGIDFEPVWYFYTNAILRDRLDQLTEMAF